MCPAPVRDSLKHQTAGNSPPFLFCGMDAGLLTQHTDHTTMFEYFMPGTEPTQYVLEEDIVDPVEEQDKPLEPEEIF